MDFDLKKKMTTIAQAHDTRQQLTSHLHPPSRGLCPHWRELSQEKLTPMQLAL